SAPDRPFNMERFWHWRCYWDYGTGAAGDLLSHEMDFVQIVLGYGIPDTCVCAGQIALCKDGREVPDTWCAVYEFEKQGCAAVFEATMNTAVQGQTPEFRGKDAMLRFSTIAQDASDFEVYAEDSDKYGPDLAAGKIERAKPFLRFDPNKTPPQPSHMEDFFNCIRSRKKTKCNEDEAFIEAATFIMSVEAFKQGRKVRWDIAKEEIV
ncbi:hypothetical protein FJY63_11750, partial [Candidatus Sumerlaeota bacterium]|nr:hypothetical protein [Candidatus Sumerlaeota bacterium]